VIVTGYEPSDPVSAVPVKVPVPSPLSANVTPAGRLPEMEIAGVGEPVVVTVKSKKKPTTA
jgi:hypothetical protein